MLQEFIDYLESHVDKAIYVWGGQGQTASEDFIKKHETGKDREKVLDLYKKRLAAGIPPNEIKAFDCSGLGTYFLYNLKRILPSDKNANGLKGLCQSVSKSSLKKGDFVFRLESSGRAHHVGYVVDDAQNVIESKGRAYGVVKKPINYWGSNYWEWYGRPKFWNEDGGEIMIQKGSKGNAVKTWQECLIKLGFSLPKYGADGDYGTETENGTKAFQKAKGLSQTGKVDIETMAAMFKALSSATNDSDKYKSQIEQIKRILGC